MPFASDSNASQGAHPQPGQRLGSWRLLQVIGSGGMGVVYKAERADGVYAQTVAIKLLHRQHNAQQLQRLQAERQILADLQLPGIARLYDGGLTPQQYPYLVMEYVRGVPFDEFARDHPLGLHQRLRLFQQVCQVVQAAHESLILHCDLKPENILVQANGQPMLLDFGLAQAMMDAGSDPIQLHTPAYASPERLRGQRAGVASDVFSLGVILVELLTEQALERGLGDSDTPVPRPSAIANTGIAWRAQLHGDLDAIAGKACALDAAARYNSVEALTQDIERYLTTLPVHARGTALPYRVGKGIRRHAVLLTAIASVITATVVGIINLQQSVRKAEQQAAIANSVTNFLVETFEVADPIKRSEQGDDSEATARSLLDNAARRIDADLRIAPRQRARMQQVLGEAYQNLGVPAQARQSLQDAYNTLSQLPHEQTQAQRAELLALLSIQHTLDGEGDIGITLAQQGLALLPAQQHGLARARLLNAQGLALTNQQAYDRAEQVYLQALRQFEQHQQHSSLEALHTRYHLGTLYNQWGRYPAARRTLQEVLAQLRGRSPVLDVAARTRLGQTLRWQGEFEQALPVLQQSLHDATVLYGADAGSLLLQHDALADLYADMGNYGAADAQYRLRQELSARVDGVDSVAYSMGSYNHGVLKHARDDLVAAQRLYQQAWQARRQHLGDQATTTLRAEVGLGLILLETGQAQKAGEHLQHADQQLAQRLPVDAPGRIQARLALSEYYLRQHDWPNAQTALDSLQPQPLSEAFRIWYWRLQANLLTGQGLPNQAQTVLMRALQLAAQYYGEHNPETARLRLDLAQVQLLNGQRSQAAQQLAQAQHVLPKALIANGPTLQRLVQLQLQTQ